PPAPRGGRGPPPAPGQVGVWRPALGAASGAIAAVILLALQPIDDTLTREAVIRLLIVAAFVGALGAAIGVTVVAAPPLDTLIARMGISGLPLRIARKLGAVFALLRAGSLIILSAVLIGGLFTVIAWLLGGSQPLHVLIGLIALVGILTARFTAPDPASPDRDTLRRQLTARLDAELKADANIWAVLSAALVLKRDDFGVRFATDLREITTIILARRAQHEAGEDILQVIEQYLGLPSGADASHLQSSASEFIWKSEHAHDYETFGAVHSGDLVSVSSQPLYVEDGSGEKRVSRKGLVTRKRGAAMRRIKYTFGLDFGTSKTAISFAQADTINPQVVDVAIHGSDDRIPTCVLQDKARDRFHVGDIAEQEYLLARDPAERA